jgi:hypothetical protein
VIFDTMFSTKNVDMERARAMCLYCVEDDLQLMFEVAVERDFDVNLVARF